jgi:hypothetical protein
MKKSPTAVYLPPANVGVDIAGGDVSGEELDGGPSVVF